ncbi:hypothetical protein Y919_09245 [Caloranaerobacter azorensis H53214]|uniref:ABC-2 type transport system permease protein n=1 Tax=Caloranaerobacter azorensis H53214 TaxID=1156417 RepID=A0A096BGM3_9FIRM|nr:ABC transporter permease [Caloranaerobacter azorensis]KGG79908.1 hypothetical protein Y919_09245 [Caloranaerobacter azorensis H53214]
MKSQTSYFNKAIIIEDLKRFWGIGALYFLALIFSGPIFFLIDIENTDTINSYFETYISIDNHVFQIIFAIIFPLILGTLIFRYMQLKNSTGMIHSFPFTRNILFNSHVLASSIILFIPIFVNFIIMFFIYNGIYTGTNIAASYIYRWLLVTLILNYTVFLMTVFTGMISGVSLIQAILSLIFLLLPLGLTGLVMLTLDTMLFGYAANDTIIENFALKVIPITGGLFGKNINPLLIIWYITLLVILFLVSKFLYNRRNLESAGDSIVFDILKPIFKYGVTFCSMILGGLYFSFAVTKNHFWLYFGFFIGALFGYIIAEMIIRKSIRVFDKLYGFIPFVLAAGLFFTIIDLDLIGYENKLPNLDEIEGAYFGSYVNEKSLKKDDLLIRNKNGIIYILKLHETIINNKSEIENTLSENRNRRIAIGYKLKNGSILMREYSVPQKMFNNNPYIKKIYELKEYKIINNSIFRIDPNKIQIIKINPMYSNEIITISNKNEIKGFIEAAKADILEESYEEMTAKQEPWAYIDVEYIDNVKSHKPMIVPEWKKSYKNLENWLKEKGYYEKARITPNDIEHAVVKNIKGAENIDNIYDFESIKGKKIEINDKEKIEKLLRTYENFSSNNKQYAVVFYLKNSNRIIGWYSDKNVPDFIKNSI